MKRLTAAVALGCVAFWGCAAQPSEAISAEKFPMEVKPRHIPESELRDHYQWVVQCVRFAFYRLGGDRSSIDAAAPTVDRAIEICDPLIVEHANAWASEMLYQLNEYYYSQPVPEQTARVIRHKLKRYMPAALHAETKR